MQNKDEHAMLIEDLRQKCEQLNAQIARGLRERLEIQQAKIQKEGEIDTCTEERLREVNQMLTLKVQARQTAEKTIQQMEGAYKQILESYTTLLMGVQKRSWTLEHGDALACMG